MEMRKRVRHGLLLFVIFLVAILVFEYFTNRKNENLTADMGAPTFPQISFPYRGYNLNPLSGYASKRTLSLIEGEETPVDDGQLELQLLDYGEKVENLKYRIYSLDGKSVLQKGRWKLSKGKGLLRLTQEARNQNTWLELRLDTKETEGIYYYTKLIPSEGKRVLENLDYIQYFHEKAMEKAEGAGIGKVIEPSEEGDNTTLSHVTIHSDYDHVTWGKLKPEVEQGERWRIQEISGKQMAVLLEYRVRSMQETQDMKRYQVKEFIQVNYDEMNGKQYLLDYERNMESLLEPRTQPISKEGIELGIQSGELEYGVNEDGSILSFVSAGELWNYNKSKDELSLIFSFSTAEGKDWRNLSSNHEISILDVDKKGNTVFTVSGYMNRGNHEGETGLALYSYRIEKNSVEEQAFLKTKASGEQVKHKFSKPIYYNKEKKKLYVLVEDRLHEIRIRTGEHQVLAEGLSKGNVGSSLDGSQMVIKTPENKENQATWLDFVSDKKRNIEIEEGHLIPLGFMKSDFVYGVAKEEEKGKKISGEEILPMTQLVIQDKEGKKKKVYEMEGIYIEDAILFEDMISLKRLSKKDGRYFPHTEDYITDNSKEKESNIHLESYQDEKKERVYRFRFEDGILNAQPKFLNPKQVLYENPVVTEISISSRNQFFVYGRGRLLGIERELGPAISMASRGKGRVLNGKQEVLWDFYEGASTGRIEEGELFSDLQSSLKEGSLPIEALQEAGVSIYYDLRGCSGKDLPSFLARHRGVIGIKDGKHGWILTGYGGGTLTYKIGNTMEERKVSVETFDVEMQPMDSVYIGF